MFGRYNIISEEDLRAAVKKITAYVSTLMSVHLKTWTVSRTTVDTETTIGGAALIPAAQGN